MQMPATAPVLSPPLLLPPLPLSELPVSAPAVAGARSVDVLQKGATERVYLQATATRQVLATPMHRQCTASTPPGPGSSAPGHPHLTSPEAIALQEYVDPCVGRGKVSGHLSTQLVASQGKDIPKVGGLRLGRLQGGGAAKQAMATQGPAQAVTACSADCVGCTRRSMKHMHACAAAADAGPIVAV